MAYIMVADDDELLTEIVRFKLESDGHRLSIAENGEQVLAAINLEQPDLLILDAMMPVLAGQQVLERLKADPATASIPVIMLTARKGEDNVIVALRLGAEDYITKPFIPDELLLRVNTILGRAGKSLVAS
jgi:DNA-binding response OmpR family regulator